MAHKYPCEQLFFYKSCLDNDDNPSGEIEQQRARISFLPGRRFIRLAEHCGVPGKSLVKNIDGLLCLGYHIFGIPPAVVTPSCTVFDM